jgi:hypothetical protein
MILAHEVMILAHYFMILLCIFKRLFDAQSEDWAEERYRCVVYKL